MMMMMILFDDVDAERRPGPRGGRRDDDASRARRRRSRRSSPSPRARKFDGYAPRERRPLDDDDATPSEGNDSSTRARDAT